jgi:hypothetical protein
VEVEMVALVEELEQLTLDKVDKEGYLTLQLVMVVQEEYMFLFPQALLNIMVLEFLICKQLILI